MIIVRASQVADIPLERAGRLWGLYALQRLQDRQFVPDEWFGKDNACGVVGTGDVVIEPVSAARTRVTLSVELDLDQADPATATEVEGAYLRALAHLERFRDFAEAKAA